MECELAEEVAHETPLGDYVCRVQSEKVKSLGQAEQSRADRGKT